MKNNLKLIFALLITILIIVVVRSLPKKATNNIVNENPSPTVAEEKKPEPTTVKTTETNEDLQKLLDSDQDKEYTDELNGIETAI